MGDFGKMGFNSYQVNDLKILMNLNTNEQRRAWIRSVDEDDFNYGIALLQVAALEALDEETADMTEFPKVRALLKKINRCKGK